jgi:hypothetical protein
MRTIYRRKELLKYPLLPWVLNRNDIYNFDGLPQIISEKERTLMQWESALLTVI